MACAGTPNGKTKTGDADWITVDSTITRELGRSLTDVLFSPKKVECYHLLREKNIDKDVIQPLEGFIRDYKIGTMNLKQIGVLQFTLLSNTRSYSEDIVSIEAPYVPVIEFEFIGNKKRTASVIISTSDRSWVIVYDGKEQFKYNYADAQLIDRFCKSLLDKYYNSKK